MKHITLSIIFIILFAVVYSQQDQDYIDGYKKVSGLFEKKEYYQAIYEMNDFLKKYTNDEPMYYNRGLARYLINDYQMARFDFDIARTLGYGKHDDLISYVLGDKELIKKLIESYALNVELDSLNGFRPLITRKDSLQGALRPERSCFDVYYYDLSVKVLPGKKKIEGQNDIYFTAIDSSMKIQIDLFDIYDIHSIRLNDIALDYSRDHNAIFIDLADPIIPGSNYVINVQYSGKPINAPQPPWNGGFIWEKKKGKHWIGVACEHLGASSWWPNKDHLSDKPDSMQIHVIVPKDLQGIANGNLRSVKDADKGYKKFTWFVSYPINNYNATLYAGDFVIINEKYENENRTYDMDYYVLPHNKKKAEKFYKQTKDVVRVFEKYFGEYPFADDGLALVEAPYAGMEHQSAIAIGDGYEFENRRNYTNTDYDYLVVHETAHEWWGNAVAIPDMADAWINEGFATYSELIFMEDIYGYSEYLSGVGETMKYIVNLWPIVGIRDVNDNTFIGGDIYDKGALTIHNLRCAINNDTLFFKIIKEFYNRYKYKMTTTYDFIELVNEISGEDYTSFLKRFLFYKEPPVLQYSFVLVDNLLSLNYQWTNVPTGFEMPFCIVLNNDTAIRLEANTKQNKIRMKDVEHFYIPNAVKYDTSLLARNAFTYFWTAWIECEKIHKRTYKGAVSQGLQCGEHKQGRWKYTYNSGIIRKYASYFDDMLHGKTTYYTTDGKIQCEENYIFDTLHGKYDYYNDEKIMIQGYYHKGNCDSTWSYYHRNGNLESKGKYDNGVEIGIWQIFNPDGLVIAECNFNDFESSWTYFDSDGNILEIIDTLKFIDTPPQYRYGEEALIKYVYDNIVIPGYIEENGKIYVSFLVGPNGLLSDFRIEKTFSEKLANSVIETIKKTERWIPAFNKGNPVVYRFYFPFEYKTKK